MATTLPGSRRLWGLLLLGFGSLMSMHSVHAGCLTKTWTVNAQSKGQTFMMAPQKAVAGYLALGFTPIDCPGDLTAVRAYIDRLCSGAPDGQIPPINTDLAIGVSRSRACAHARAGLAVIGAGAAFQQGVRRRWNARTVVVDMGAQHALLAAG